VRNSSIYQGEEKGKGKIIVGIGIILGICLGMFLAFVREFWEGYNRRKEEQHK
jgi:uncharacterized protein involved in exopolysaccharide biosynthesis